jgi:hypothetical protein
MSCCAATPERQAATPTQTSKTGLEKVAIFQNLALVLPVQKPAIRNAFQVSDSRSRGSPPLFSLKSSLLI